MIIIFYHINCKIIFYHWSNNCSAANYFVMCTNVSHVSIENVLNGMNVGVNNSNRKEPLSLNQKFNFERDLKDILPSRFIKYHIDSNVNANSFHGYHNTTSSSDYRCSPRSCKQI